MIAKVRVNPTRQRRFYKCEYDWFAYSHLGIEKIKPTDSPHRDRGKAFLMLGLADGDQLLKAARRSLHVTYHSDLYAASWSPGVIDQLDGRIPYIEIATL